MSEWLHGLPVVSMTVVIVAATYALAAAIGALVVKLAAVSVALIASHDRPFTGEISVGPGVLQQVMPDEPAPSAAR